MGNFNTWAAAWADYDGDGDPDVFTAPHLQYESGVSPQLWRNNGDGTFTDVLGSSGIHTITGDTHGVVWGDFDGDRDPDLYVVNGSPKVGTVGNENNRLFRNEGNGSFTEVGESAGVIGIDHRGRGAYAFDVNIDGKLDIFSVSFSRSTRDLGNLLFLNNGSLSFTDIAPAAGIALDDNPTRTAAWGDINNDGYPDVMIIPSCLLYMNQGNNTFVDVTAASGISASDQCTAAAMADYDNDGDLDLYSSRGFSLPTPDKLFKNNGDGTFVDVTAISGISDAAGSRSVAWGDYDNDGDQDIYVVSLNHTLSPNFLYRNNGDGTFTNVTAETGTAGLADGAGADGSFVDYNNDGYLDLFLTNGEGNNAGPYTLLKNSGGENHWFKLKLRGNLSNSDGLSSHVQVTSALTGTRNYYNGAPHFMSQSVLPMHMGLGSDTSVTTLTVKWPNGSVQTVQNLAADQVVTLEEGKSVFADAPSTFSGLGFYVWQGKNGGWNIQWRGDSTSHNFNGTITSDTNITKVVPASMETGDTYAVSGNVLTFSGSANGLSPDTLLFVTTGKQITFDLTQDGAAQPRNVYLGTNKVLPGSLPFTLNR